MAESGEFSVDAAVAPVGVLACESDDESAEFGVDRCATSSWCWWLGPVSGDESSVPLQDGFWLDDQECQCSPWAIDSGAEDREDCSVGLIELRAVDLTLQNEDLMSESQDLGVSGISGAEYPADSSEDKSGE